MKRIGSLFLLVILSTGTYAQIKVAVSGVVKDHVSSVALPYVNVILKTGTDSTFVAGTVTTEDGRYTINGITPGNYVLETSYVGYAPHKQSLLVGKLSEFLDLGMLSIEPITTMLQEITVSGTKDEVAETLEKKTFSIADNINQSGGSLLQVMQNLPGVTISEEGTVKLRGSDKVAVLVDGKQTALTGFGNQRALDNIPASAIERIEVINNPSSKYDANGNAGIINIVYKKEVKEGFNGKVGFTGGLGALWEKRENYPTIRPQYSNTPKINPSVSVNYRKKKINLFLQADDLYTKTLNKNEFVDRFYDNGDIVRQQTKRNRTTNIVTAKGGFDWYVNNNNTLTVSGLFSSEKILDRGDEPFFNGDLSERQRLWQFLEDELKTTVTAMAAWQHKFKQPGRSLNVGVNYTFHREDEKYFFTNILPTYTGLDSFKLLSDEHVADFTVDYVQPLRYGRFETGLKFRNRFIPTNMQFIPGLNSPLDVSAGGWADYSEVIPAAYGNYVFENQRFEIEAGLRVEYVDIYYKVNPDHSTYKSDGYNYTQPFPNLRFAVKLDNNNTLSLFYNRRVDRPNEVDIRIFPKYDDAEIIKVGNPGLRPQFTNTVEVGYKTSWSDGYLYSSLYHKSMDATITRIASTVPGSDLIYNIFQNAGHSYTSGIEIILSQNVGKWAVFNLNLNGYQNIVEAFQVVNKYPQENTFAAERQEIFSGNMKLNGLFHLPRKYDVQFTSVYSAPDIVPQGKTYSRFYVDLGIKKSIQSGKGEVFLNASDIGNTLRIKKEVQGAGFHYVSKDYYETQVVRLGYTYKF
ncbi:outer membrane beta-barrel family protein [Chryseolinea lacunae]|uniref:TonB-dependent receptor n=1 Tax=Chryseolinea lacunae TaxID=2801331 RepID=A0ABS1KN58_9BACT|nr:outer membrane beta-barrel family protein [Chryseolinea lacunae]MBL0740682.1 TonB-dependent receptor [Chryseolinea lacunae]